jgi:hypothetical protein
MYSSSFGYRRRLVLRIVIPLIDYKFLKGRLSGNSLTANASIDNQLSCRQW